ncbi:cysteine hydrolase [Rhodococcus rhodochrous]|uniref:Cysteine hydrolase n=1 Tax=Rhodococcus rhodochrous TaxID=1829 RepID=A0AAW4XE09_RHORH|nr:isochorismatase family cysteine hydrolase [Rhodococcus rhodochrous]MCD2110995.1 cysteine hydrolase [Rhodococcus rhodochrous]
MITASAPNTFEERTPVDESGFRYDPQRCALVVVDMQNDFCSTDGALAGCGFDVSAPVAMTPRLAELIDRARRRDVPVVWVRTEHDETTDTPQWLGRVGTGPGTARTALTCRPGTAGADFYGVRPEPGEPVIVKHRFSAFVGTDLDSVLRSRGIESLLFTGVATEICVESSLRSGLFHEYWVSLVEDCAASYSPAAHAASVAMVAQNFGTVVTADDLASMWVARPITASTP